MAWWDWTDDKVDRFIPLLLDPDIDPFLTAAEADARLVPPALPNIAMGRPVRQSSLFPWSERASTTEDAGGLVSATLTGGYRCHTDMEDGPWWQSTSAPGRWWRRCGCTTGSTGSRRPGVVAVDPRLRRREGLGRPARTLRTAAVRRLDGRPLVWRADGNGVSMRFLRVALRGFTCLHLD